MKFVAVPMFHQTCHGCLPDCFAGIFADLAGFTRLGPNAA
jgi:hypothetical protein